MLFFNPVTLKVEYLDDQTGVVSHIIPVGNSNSKSPREPENPPVLLHEAMFRVLLTLSSTLFSSMIMWTASPEDKEKLYNEEREDHKQVSHTWEKLIEKVGKMINKDEEVSNMALGDLLVGLIGWVEGMIITTWDKTGGDIKSSALEIIQGAPKRVVDLVMLEMEISQKEDDINK